MRISSTPARKQMISFAEFLNAFPIFQVSEVLLSQTVSQWTSDASSLWLQLRWNTIKYQEIFFVMKLSHLGFSGRIQCIVN